MKRIIINCILLMLFVAAVRYCVCYPKSSRSELMEVGTHQVVIKTQESDISVLSESEETDPYEEDYLPVSVQAQCNDIKREISLYVSNGVCYAFLPSYTDQSKLACVFDDTTYKVWVNNQSVATGETLRDVEIGAEYRIEILNRESEKLCYNLIFLQSRNVPAVFIDTQSGSMDYVDKLKGNEESGQFLCVTEDGVIDSNSTMSRIRGRGNTSWSGIDKKNQYNVQLAQPTDVLHMGSAQNWVVQANKFDVSMMRNKLAYDFAKDIGVPYGVDSQFADMYFNGRYYGTYQIIEKVEIGSNRIDIDEETGYLIERDFREKDPNKSFGIKYGTYAIRFPKDITEEEHDYIADYVNKVADCINEAPHSDEYLNYIDVNSFAKLFIMNEVSNDPDANALSTYFYKADETNQTKLVAGPVWDFDISFCNDERGIDILCSTYGEEWFTDLYQNEVFREEVAGVLQDIMRETYEKYDKYYFDDMQVYLEPSYRMNEIRWKEKRGYISTVYPEFDETMGFLKYYFITRLNNLNSVFNGEERYHKVQFVVGGLNFAHVYVADGEVIPLQTLQGIEEYYGRGNWRLENDQLIDPVTYQVFDDVIIKCRSIRNDEDTEIEDGQLEAEQIELEEKEVAKKGELAMQWISFIMLMVPGGIALWLSGQTQIRKENAFTILMQYLFNSFLILLVAYGIFYVIYGSAVLSFSDIYDDAYQFSIYNINVAFKYLLLAGVLSVVVGTAERFIGKIVEKHRVK